MWSQPTAAEILCLTSTGDRELLFKGLEKTEAQIMEQFISEAVSEIRASIACCSKNQRLGPAGTIPHSTKSIARSLIMYQLWASKASKIPDNIESAWTKACRKVAGLAECQPCVEPPGGLRPAQSGNAECASPSKGNQEKPIGSRDHYHRL